MVWYILTPFYRTHFSKGGSIDYADRLCLSIYLFYIELTHLSLVPHIYVNDSGSIGSYNGLLPIRCQAIIWGNDSLLSMGTLRTNFSEIIIGSRTFSSKKMYLNFLNTICEMAAILSRERPPLQKMSAISNQWTIITWYDGFLPPVRCISAPGTTLFGPVVCLHCFNFVTPPPPPPPKSAWNWNE